jgi:hypothetical protein
MEWRAQTTATLDVDNLTMNQVGCLVDLDMSQINGDQVLDWSGRYPAAITGTAGAWDVVRPKYRTSTVPSGLGTLTVGLRKYAEKVLVLDDAVKTITHNLALGSTAPLTGYEMIVGAWDLLTMHQLSVGVVRLSPNAVNVTFHKIGAPTTAKDVVVVVTA